MEHFFSPCPRGLEAALADELRRLGAEQAAPTSGGVAFAGEMAVAYAANLHSRLATRVLLRVASGGYQREDDIYQLARSVRWTGWFAPERTFKVSVTAIKSPLKSLEFITLRIKDAVCDRFRDIYGIRPSIDTRQPDVRVQAFLTADHCMLYLDTSGDPLYQRGLRQKTVDAPLKENLAAGILHLSGWRPGTPLFDPMCGSGTFLLEAAQQVKGIAPGAGRPFAFEKLDGFDKALWARLQAAAEPKGSPAGPLTLFGADRDPRAMRAAMANLDRAGLLDAVDLRSGDFLDAQAPAAVGVLVCNPPYGVRLEEQEALAGTYPDWGRVLKQGFSGWTACFLSADTRLPKGLGLRPSRKTPLFNGALECRLYAFEMVAGSNRRERPTPAT
jgi:putative N6-adenine-specific DNA methylase